jgi:hypothetical protein
MIFSRQSSSQIGGQAAVQSIHCRDVDNMQRLSHGLDVGDSVISTTIRGCERIGPKTIQGESWSKLSPRQNFSKQSYPPCRDKSGPSFRAHPSGLVISVLSQFWEILCKTLDLQISMY